MSDLKKCTMCKVFWKDINAVLEDRCLIFCGYQPFFEDPRKGLFLFTHAKKDCGTTIGFPLYEFQPIIDKNTKLHVDFSPFEPDLENDPDCEGLCLNSSDLSPCKSKTCTGVSIRDLVQDIKKRSTPRVLFRKYEC